MEERSVALDPGVGVAWSRGSRREGSNWEFASRIRCCQSSLWFLSSLQESESISESDSECGCEVAVVVLGLEKKLEAGIAESVNRSGGWKGQA